jgi:hypothetical protein
MDSSKFQGKNKDIKKGRIKGTSAFNIQKAEHIEEISWSNNKFESTYNIEGNEADNRNSNR